MNVRRFIATVALLAAGVAAGNAPAQVLVSTSEQLVKAVAAANLLDEPTEIVLAAGDYPVTDTLTVTGPVTIRGAGMDTTSIYHTGNTEVGVLSINNAEACVTGMSISNGACQASLNGVYNAGGVLIGAAGGTLDACRVAWNRAQKNVSWNVKGIGLAVVGAAGLVKNCIVENNQSPNGDADTAGIGAYLYAGVMSNCLVRSQHSPMTGAGVYAAGSSKVLATTITGNMQEPTLKKTAGSGLYVDGTSVVVSNCLLKGNQAYGDAGDGAPDWYCKNANAKQKFFNCEATVPVGTVTDPDVTPGCDFFTYVEPTYPLEGTINVPADCDIYEAVEKAAGGAVIKITGFLTLTRELVVERGILLEGVGGKTAAGLRRTVGDKAPSFRLLVLNHPDAKAKGLEISGGRLSDYMFLAGANVFIGPKGGMLEDCLVKDGICACWNSSGAGVAMFSASGLLDRCEIVDNNAKNNDGSLGGGVYMTQGWLDNSLVEGNSCAGGAGGVYADGASVIRNCTIVGNTSKAKNGGGLYVKGTAASVVNTVISGNTAIGDATDGAPEWYTASADVRGAFANCASSKEIGRGCQTEKITFEADGYVPALDSSLVNNGAEIDGFDEVDLKGDARVSGDVIDIGCYEVQIRGGTATIAYQPEVRSVTQGRPMELSATLIGATGSSYAWTVRHSDGTERTSSDAEPSFAFDAVGVVTVELTVTDTAGNELTDSGSWTVRPAQICVSNSGTGIWPCSDWTTATNDIYAAVDYAADGCEIVVDGMFTGLDRSVVVDKGIVIRSRAGRFDDAGFVMKASSGYRVFEINHAQATVRGLTIANGYNSVDSLNKHGGGVFIGAAGGRLEDCLVTNCVSAIYAGHGAGVACVGAAGVISRCVIARNFLSDSRHGGVALSAGILENSLVVGNYQDERWTTASTGGGGGIYLFGDGAPVVRNCTVAANRGLGAAGIECLNGSALVENTVCFCNSNDTDVVNHVYEIRDWSNKNVACYQRCAFTATAPNGDCQVVANPGFSVRKGVPYAIGDDSPLKDAGVFGSWMTDATDIRGRPRKSGPSPDIGYYEYFYTGMVIIVN